MNDLSEETKEKDKNKEEEAAQKPKKKKPFAKNELSGQCKFGENTEQFRATMASA